MTELNRAFTAWLISAYHEQVNRETNQTPRERYFTENKISRPIAIDAVLPIFHLSEYRIVDSTFSDVVLKSTYYQVDPKFRGLKLRVHYDPFIGPITQRESLVMSYLEHFKFTRQPFSEHASRDALWNDTRMEEGLSRLNYLLGNGLVGLVTGASGLGKSALVRRFIQDCSPQVCDPQYCHLAQLPGSSLLKLIVTLLGEVPKFGKDRLYSQILDRAKRSEGTMLLILDEAHLLSGDALVDLRLLVSSAVEAGPPLKILLVGQESLRHTLKRAEYVDIVNRISVRYQLKAFSKDQTHKYIDYLVGSSGGDVKIFDGGVKDLIHENTGGNPRGINNVAMACLLGAVSRRAARIDEEIFRQAAQELQWN